MDMAYDSGNDVWTSTRPPLLDGLAYKVRMQATDKAGNVEPLQTQTGFTYDLSSPTTKVGLPVAGSNLSSLATISGTVFDNTGLAGVSKVEVAVQVDTGTWYNYGTRGFSVGTEAAGYFDAKTDDGFVTWYATVPWTTGHLYGIKAKAWDKAGNKQDIFPVGVSTITFTFDNSTPTIVISTPIGVAGGAPRMNYLPTISGTAGDNLSNHLMKVEVRIRNNAGQQNYYDPATPRELPDFTLNEGNAAAWFTATTANNYANWYATFTWADGQT